MTLAETLLVGPPSSLRDNYELVLRRRGIPVTIASDFRSAQLHFHRESFHAVVIADPEADNVDGFVRTLHQFVPRVPVLFAGQASPECIARLTRDCNMMVIPPGVAPEILDNLLFPTADAPISISYPSSSRSRSRPVIIGRRSYSVDFKQARMEFESEFLTRVLEREHGNISRVARVVGVARRNLQLKIMAYGIDMSRIRSEDEDEG
ncbi:MAG: helix-turn-helix domain-containing protein [bacterium]|nr:helix-turn-helix domain-containing protein [bacterium]